MKRVALADLMKAGIENTECVNGPKGTTEVAKTKTACAIGAAMFPVHADMTNVDAGQLLDLLETTDIEEETHSTDYAEVSLCGSLYGCLWRLNDIAGLTREEICEWVRSIEDKYDLYLEVEEETPEPALPIPA
jgi:hypothetical protein